jgi:hypothetical protein
MKVSIPMFWILKPSGTCPYQALNHNCCSVKNKGGIRQLLGHSVHVVSAVRQIETWLSH